jgi:hypothetical protein
LAKRESRRRLSLFLVRAASRRRLPFDLLNSKRSSEKLLGNYSKSQSAEISIERKAWHIVEERGDHDKRYRVTKGQASNATTPAKNLFGFVTYALAVVYKGKIRFHLVEKGYCLSEALAVAQESDSFTDDIPSREDRRRRRCRIVGKFFGSVMIVIVRIEARVEK